jgi:hypothetical protein
VRTCKAAGDSWSCDRGSDAHSLTKGLCKSHYAQFRRGKQLTPVNGATRAGQSFRSCQFDACARAVSARGLCAAHYQQWSKGQPLSPLRQRRGNGVYRAMVERGILQCLGCGEDKPLSDYSALNASGTPRPYCKPCNAERVRLGHYNVTKEFVDLLLRFQQEVCALCAAANGDSKTLHIDHDHGCCPGRRSCGDCVRGLVCANCNAYGLAWYEALPAELRTFDLLNDYIAEPPARRLRAELAAFSVE